MSLYVCVSGLYVNAEVWTLKSLEAQTDKDFTLIFLDPEFDPAVPDKLDEFSRKTGVKALRVLYQIPPGSRKFDWSIFNSPFLIPDSEDDFVLRLQSWRLIPSNFIQIVKSLNCNVGLVRSNLEVDPPTAYKTLAAQFSTHEIISNNRMDGACGDWCLKVKDQIEVNGIDEPATMLFHFEDVEWGYRWRKACDKGLISKGVVIKNLMYHMQEECRKVIAQDLLPGQYTKVRKEMQDQFPQPCKRCNDQWPELQAINSQNVNLKDIPNNQGMVDLGVYCGKHWFYCKECDSVLFHLGSPHFTINYQGDEHRATIGLRRKFGRNLKLAREKALKMSMDNRLRYVGLSYTDPEVVSPEFSAFAARTMFEERRWSLLEEACQAIESVAGGILEIGCHKAGLAGYLANRFPHRSVMAFDRFEKGLSEVGPHDMPQSDSYHEGVQGTDFEDSRKFLNATGGGAKLISGDVRETVVPWKVPTAVALAIIDVNLYEPTKHALATVYPKLSYGGWIIVDDIDFPGVKKAVEESGYPFQVDRYTAVIKK